MKQLILNATKEAAQAASQLQATSTINFINELSQTLINIFETGHKVIIAGNGGSLCDAMHFSEELTGQFRKKRKALPAIALCEPGHLTCVANDMGFDEVFARGVEAYGAKGDIFIGLTTSGRSFNIIRAFEVAKENGLLTASFLGKTGGFLKGVADHELLISGFNTSDRIQEVHMAAIHIIIEAVEEGLFYAPNKKILTTATQ